MDINELNKYLQSLPEMIIDNAAEIVAETATEYYKESFRKKAFNGNSWKETKVPKRTGSLLIDSGALLGSIHPSEISSRRVVISAGNDKADYAQVHNEGYSGAILVPAYTRRTRKGKTEVKEHIRQFNMPQRQFLGESAELNDIIHDRIEKYIESLNL